jgi:hypothetical protein
VTLKSAAISYDQRRCSLSLNVDRQVMLRTLLTPLRLRFDSSPRSAVTNNATTPSIPDEEELDPEDFARDVLIELMRISVDKLKLAETTHARMEVRTLSFDLFE